VKNGLLKDKIGVKIRVMFAILFIVEFVLLFLLARYLIKSLSRVFFRITKSEKITIAILSYFFLPGTIVHELSHLLAAGLLLVKTGDMELTPKIIEDGVRLGSVEVEKTDILRRAVIGVAPVLIGMAVIFGTLFYLQTLKSANLIIYALAFWIIFEVANTLFSSRKDLEGTLELLITSSILLTAVFILKPEIMRQFFALFQKADVINFFKHADLFLTAPILIDLICLSITKSLFLKRS
jgi:hypothetical protein